MSGRPAGSISCYGLSRLGRGGGKEDTCARRARSLVRFEVAVAGHESLKRCSRGAAARCRGSLPFCTFNSDKDEKAENPEAVNRVPKHNPLSVEVKVKEIHV